MVIPERGFYFARQVVGREMMMRLWSYYSASRRDKAHDCVNNKMLEHDWLLTALIYAIIGCFRSNLSDNLQTFVIGQLSSQ